MKPHPHPLPSDWTVSEGLEIYLSSNGFDAEHYKAKWTPVTLWGIRFAVPNTKRHQWAIARHDLHHVATGYGTDLRGEAEISLWELRKGIRSLGFYTGMIVVSICLFGPLMAPRRSLRAWRAGKGKPSLFGRADLDYEQVLTWTIGALRETLGVPAEGLVQGQQGFQGGAPTADDLQPRS